MRGEINWNTQTILLIEVDPLFYSDMFFLIREEKEKLNLELYFLYFLRSTFLWNSKTISSSFWSKFRFNSNNNGDALWGMREKIKWLVGSIKIYSCFKEEKDIKNCHKKSFFLFFFFFFFGSNLLLFPFPLAESVCVFSPWAHLSRGCRDIFCSKFQIE